MAQVTIEQAIDEFRKEAAPLVAACEWKQLRQVFARWAADARVSNTENQLEATSAMREALRELLHAPSRRVKQGFFNDV